MVFKLFQLVFNYKTFKKWDFFLFLLISQFAFAGKPKVLRFWLKISSMPSRKMILNGKVCKTGSHIVFILLGTICDEKKMILAAAFPGQKKSEFFANLQFKSAVSNVKRIFATNVATGTSLSTHLLKIYWTSIGRVFFSKCH